MRAISAAETAVFNPAYCLTLDRARLTDMGQEAVIEAARLLLGGEAILLIVSAAYDVWEKERDLKLQFLRKLCVVGCTEVIGPVNDSYDEVRQVLAVIRSREERTGYPMKRLVVVGDSEQGPRAVKAFKSEVAKRGIELEVVGRYFRASKLERTYEPHRIKLLGWVKSVRAGNRFLWALWNRLLILVS